VDRSQGLSSQGGTTDIACITPNAFGSHLTDGSGILSLLSTVGASPTQDKVADMHAPDRSRVGRWTAAVQLTGAPEAATCICRDQHAE